MKNKVWFIPSLVVFVLLISSKDISSQELKDKVVVYTPNGKVTIISDDPLKACARMIQASFKEELRGRGVEPPHLVCNDAGDCTFCCFGNECKPDACCNPNPCPRGPGEPPEK